MKRKKFENLSLTKEDLDFNTWPTVNLSNLSSEYQIKFINRKKAIELYFEGNTIITDIYIETGINSTDLYRMVERCLTYDKYGKVYGYRALIPGYRIKSYERIKDINGFKDDGNRNTGAFEKFMQDNLIIKNEIDNIVLKKKKGASSTQFRGKDIHKKFVQLCKEQNIRPEKGEYPFNSKDIGKRSLYRYINKLKHENPRSLVSEFGKDAEKYFSSTGIGEQNTIVERPFERVELDGHQIDVSLAIKYTTVEGDEVTQNIKRLWLLAIIDTATSVVLGYHISLNNEYTTMDVMHCIYKSIFPHHDMEFTIDGLEMPSKGGFHSDCIPSTKFAIWDEICFDNAKAHLAKELSEKLKTLVGCHINVGPVATPTRRPFIESFFKSLEENGFHRVVSTTGSSPKDPRRLDSEKKAVEFEITPDEIEQLTEVIIAQHNGKSKKGLNYLSPLEVMEQRINRNFPFRKLDEKHKDGDDFFTTEVDRTIRGSYKSGKRPYIHFEGVDYRNDVLSEAFSLVGTKLRLVINVEDLRTLKAFLPDGSELGLLKARGKWGIRKHSLRLRKAINSLFSKGEIFYHENQDPIEVYHAYLNKKARKNKNQRTKMVALKKIINEKDTFNAEDKSIDTSPEIFDSNIDSFVEKDRKPKKINNERLFFNS